MQVYTTINNTTKLFKRDNRVDTINICVNNY